MACRFVADYDSLRVFRVVMMTDKSFGILVLLLGLVALHAPVTAQEKDMVLPSLASASLLNDLQARVAVTPYLGDGMTIGLVLRYGSAFDPAAKSGEAYLTSRLFSRATLDRTEKDIQDEMNYLHASLEVICDWDGIRLLMRGSSATYERCLLLLYQIVCEAKFNEDDFAKVKGELLQQLQSPEDPRQRIRRQFESELFRGTTYARYLRGTPASVQNIQVGDVRYFYRHFFSPGEASLVVVGNVPAEIVLQKITRIWGIWIRTDDTPATFLPPVTPAGRNIFLEDDPTSPAAQYILGNLGPNREEPMYYSDMIALRLLQMRLTQALPASRVTVADEARRMAGPFYIQGQAAAEQAGAEIGKIVDTVEAFKESQINADEVTRVQNSWIAEFAKSIHTTDGICNTLLDAELYRLGTNYLATFPDFVRRCDPSTVKEAAKRLFFPGGLILIVRGPSTVLHQQLEVLGSVQPLKR